MKPAEIGQAVGSAVKSGGPWVLAVLALLLVGWMVIEPGARADSFTGSQGKALAAKISAHAGVAAHPGAARDLAVIKAKLDSILRELDDIKKRLP